MTRETEPELRRYTDAAIRRNVRAANKIGNQLMMASKKAQNSKQIDAARRALVKRITADIAAVFDTRGNAALADHRMVCSALILAFGYLIQEYARRWEVCERIDAARGGLDHEHLDEYGLIWREMITKFAQTCASTGYRPTETEIATNYEAVFGPEVKAEMDAVLAKVLGGNGGIDAGRGEGE
jgi:hypothetical protein